MPTGPPFVLLIITTEIFTTSTFDLQYYMRCCSPLLPWSAALSVGNLSCPTLNTCCPNLNTCFLTFLTYCRKSAATRVV